MIRSRRTPKINILPGSAPDQIKVKILPGLSAAAGAEISRLFWALFASPSFQDKWMFAL